MMTRAQYSQALSVLQRLADANESQAELLRAIQDDLTELRAVKRMPSFAPVEATSDFTRTTPTVEYFPV